MKHLTLLLRSVRLKRIHGNVVLLKDITATHFQIQNPVLKVNIGNGCHLTSEDTA